MASLAQIAQYAHAAGINDNDSLSKAVAIAWAESGGNAKAHNGIGKDDSYGLWQINMKGDMGPDRRKRFGLTSNEQLYDPATNARAMYAISGGGKNWSDWTTYNGARYRLVLPLALVAASGVVAPVGGPVGDAIEGTAGAAQAAAGAAEAAQAAAGQALKASAWMADRNNWFRVAKVAIGGALIIGGLAAVSRGYVAKAAGQVISVVAPVGKAAKVIGKVAK